MSVAAGFLERLDALDARFDAAAARAGAGGLTSPDARTGERWDRGQVWAHVAELVPYWIDQAHTVLAAADDDAPFGRTVTDAGRVGAIERDRAREVSELRAELARNVLALRAFVGGLSEADWERRGTHPTLGRMSVEGIVESFLVGHLEEHASQLEELPGRT